MLFSKSESGINLQVTSEILKAKKIKHYCLYFKAFYFTLSVHERS